MNFFQRALPKKTLPLLAIAATTLTTAGCSNSELLSSEQKAQAIDEIKVASQQTIEELVEKKPDIVNELERARGYMVAEVSSTKVPLVGKAKGTGAIYDNATNSITYVDLEREDIGVGLGHSEYKIVSVFEDEESIEVFRRGVSSAKVTGDWKFTEGNLSSFDVKTKGKTVPTYTLNKNGGKASLAASFVDINKNEELTDTGITNTLTPMKDKAKDKVSPPKHWDRALPFFGQRVIELGHDLPRPIGISFIYASTSQNMELYDLSVRNKEGEYVPIEFVPFEDNTNESYTPQIKLDAWVFPFMNVFGSVGKVSGDANVNFSLNGDDLLSQLGIECDTARGQDRRRCDRWEGNNTDTYNVNVSMEGVSYTLGTVLAAGWSNYFVSVPISFTKMTMDNRSIDGNVIAISPRVGKVFPFQNGTSLAVYAGASYMDNEVHITGHQKVPGSDEGIDYQISQRTDDLWEPLIGANYNFDQKWSAFVEWTGTNEGRKQFTGGINRRF
ncbi:lipoprotein [Agarivorans albus]